MVDSCFDNKLFKDNTTRDDMNCFEELIEFLLKNRLESYVKIHQLMKRIEEEKIEIKYIMHKLL